MQTPADSPDGYPRTVFEDTQRYIQKLLDGNDRARRRIAGLEADNAVLERERLEAREEMVGMRERLARCREDHAELQRRLSEVENESRSYADEYLALERRNSNLVNLYVAGYGLHGTLDRAAVLQTIQEIVINLIGSEEVAILELDGAGFRMAGAFGLGEERCQALAPDRGLVGRVMATAEPWIAGRADDDARTEAERHLTACIPLAVEGRVFGAVVLFRLLPQKSAGLVDLDHELLELLAAQAGTALFCSTLYGRHGADALAAAEAAG